MLPAAAPLTDDDAQAWLRAGLPRWLTCWTPVVLWVLAFVASVATDDTRCTPADPSVCGPDHVFAFFVVLAVATPVLFLGMPLLACACGIAFAAADQRYDLVAVSRAAYAVHGAVCLLVAVLVVRSRRAQRQVVARFAPVAQVGAPVDPGWSVLRVGVALLMVPVAAASFWWYDRVSTAEERHLARASVVSARVVAASSDDSTITLEVAEGINDSRTLVVDVLDTHAYPLGEPTPLLLDPEDPSWRRLVAEPYDPTGWQALGNGAVGLMAVAAGGELRRRRAVRQIVSGRQRGVQVRAVVQPDLVTLLPAEPGGSCFGTLRALRPDRERPPSGDPTDSTDAPDFGDLWRGADADDLADDADEASTVPAEPAVLVGDLRGGGWVVLVTEDGVLAPRLTLRPAARRGRSVPDALARLRRRAPRTAEPVEDGLLPGVPVGSGDEATPLDLPSVVRPLRRERQLGVLCVAGALIAAPAAVLWLADGWYQRGTMVLVGGQLLLAGLRRSRQHLRLGHDRLDVAGAWRGEQVPWDRLHGARLEGAQLLLAWEPDVVLALGPLEVVGSSLDPDAVARSVGATAVRLRERALALGSPGRPVRRVPGAGRDVLVTYGLLCAAALWLAR